MRMISILCGVVGLSFLVLGVVVKNKKEPDWGWYVASGCVWLFSSGLFWNT